MLISKQSSYASDLWALGIIIFQFLTNTMPFKGKTQDHTFELIKKGEFIIPSYVDDSARDLIKKLLVLKPEDRLGAQNMQDLKNHIFFKDIDFNTIKDQIPPACKDVSFELTEAQKKQINYLPKYMKTRKA